MLEDGVGFFSVLCSWSESAEAPVLQADDPSSFAHEAGFDAFMTGATFAGQLQLLELRRGGAGGRPADEAAPPSAPPQPSAAAELVGQLNLVR